MTKSGKEEKAYRVAAPGKSRTPPNRLNGATRRDMSRIRCYKCQKFGHFQSTCPEGGASGNVEDKELVALQRELEKEKIKAQLVLLKNKADSQYLTVDSGCTKTMVPTSKMLENVVPTPKRVIHTADANHTLQSNESGTLTIRTSDKPIVIPNVLVVPDLEDPLLSVKDVVKSGHTVLFDPIGGHIRDENDHEVVFIPEENGVYNLSLGIPNMTNHVKESARITKLDDSYSTWHERLGHLGGANMIRLASMATGIPLFEVNKPETICHGCQTGKQTRNTFKHDSEKERVAYLPGEMVHLDLRGPFRVPAIGTYNRYSMQMIDGASEYTREFQLRYKSDAFSRFKLYVSTTERISGNKLKVVKCDGAKEFVEGIFRTYCNEKGITYQISQPYQHESNGKIERTNRTIMDKALAMIHGNDLPTNLWGEASLTANYLKNRSPSAIDPTRTPYELMFGAKPDLKHLRIFGCNAYIQIPLERRLSSPTYQDAGKPAPRSTLVRFLGYSIESTGWRFWDDKSGCIVESRNAVFDESQYGGLDKATLDDINIYRDHSLWLEQKLKDDSVTSKGEQSIKRAPIHKDNNIYNTLLEQDDIDDGTADLSDPRNSGETEQREQDSTPDLLVFSDISDNESSTEASSISNENSNNESLNHVEGDEVPAPNISQNEVFIEREVDVRPRFVYESSSRPDSKDITAGPA